METTEQKVLEGICFPPKQYQTDAKRPLGSSQTIWGSRGREFKSRHSGWARGNYCKQFTSIDTTDDLYVCMAHVGTEIQEAGVDVLFLVKPAVQDRCSKTMAQIVYTNRRQKFHIVLSPSSTSEICSPTFLPLLGVWFVMPFFSVLTPTSDRLRVGQAFANEYLTHKGRVFVDFSPCLLHNMFIKQRRSNCMATEKEIKHIEKGTIYDLRLLIKNSDKETYTKEEMLDFLDTFAEAKAQE